MTISARGRDLHALLAAPTIPVRNAYDEIDLDDVGDADLETLIHYEGIALGDRLSIQWTGASALGEPLDVPRSELEVEPDNFDPVSKSVRAYIPNHFLRSADQGYAFYSYEVTAPALGASLRTFCFVGVRTHRMEHMPVAQAVESHALHIDLTTLPSNGATFVVPPYQAMQANDNVTLTVLCYDDTGALDQTLSESKIVDDQGVGKCVEWQVEKEEFDWIDGGHIEVYYTIDFTGAGGSLQGPTQVFQIDPVPAIPGLLPALEIDDYSGGQLDPRLFPNGLTLRVPGHAQLHTADWTVLHWNDTLGLAAARADLTTLETGITTFQVPAKELENLTDLRLSYQCAREGLGLMSLPLDIEVLLPRDLQPPQVDKATSELGDEEYSARLNASDATGGAFVEVPALVLRPDEVLELHWVGRSERGTHVTRTAESGQPLRFSVPASVVAANMEARDKETFKRFPVFYRIVQADGRYEESPKLHLSINPLARDSYTVIQATNNSGTQLSLRNVPGTGEGLTQVRWPFMAPGQLIRIQYRGIQSTGAALVQMLRNSATTEAESSAGQVLEVIPRDVLAKQKLGELFDVRVSVNFENSGSAQDTWVEFNYLTLTLVA
ncbi:hypothetical protein J2W83_004279 [Pseudomonas hunanensis]|uniref:Uncharacterized protein n=1 Tax=Pseudomonas hunanensis TaxID=1247546 RepID=A0ACC6K824_9PSED|nr:hypothetical protein [Pseudomonas hunanensis]MDR6714643.1 hypothetical protein [Pseudomonas hunanensis]